MSIKTENALLELGIAPNLKGFDYICEAVEILSKSKDRMKIVDGLYVDIASKFSANKTQVERNIRHAISKMDKDSEAWNKYLGIKDTTNSAVLYTLAMKLQED